MHNSIDKYEDICELKKAILKYVTGQIADGLSANGQEVAILGEYVDMVKDLAEAEKSCQEACYYESVVRMGQYSETHSEKDRREMKEHANEHMAEAMTTLREIWADADPDLKARMKADLTKLTSEMTV